MGKCPGSQRCHTGGQLRLVAVLLEPRDSLKNDGTRARFAGEIGAVPMIMGGVKRPFYERSTDPIVEGHLYLHNIFSHQHNLRNPVLAAWGFLEHGDKQTFHPFWRNAELVSITPAGQVKCSLLKQQNKVLVVATNYDKKQAAECTISVKLDAPGLRLPPEAAYRAAALRPAGADLKYEINDGVISISSITIKPRDYVLISVQP